MGQSLGCYLAGISSRFVWLSSFCYYACWVGQSLVCYLVGIISRFACLNVGRFFFALLFLCWLRRSVIGLLLGWQFFSPNFPIDCHLSNLYQTFNVTVQTRAAVSLASRLVLTIFFFFIVSNNFSLSSFHASFASFCGASATVVWLVADFCRPIFYSVG